MVCFLLGAANLFADTKLMSPQQRFDQLNTELKLTNKQKPQVKGVLEATAKGFNGLPNPQSLSKSQLQERGKRVGEIMGEEVKKMKEILTTDQFEKYRKLPLTRPKGTVTE
jgi:hypothetical protein